MHSNRSRLRKDAPRRTGLAAASLGAAALLALLPALLRGADPAATPPASLPAEVTSSSRPAPHYTKAAVIPIDSEITDVTLTSLRRRLAQSAKDGADLVVLEMDTPGGMVTSALKICDTIKDERRHTVAWVHTKAYSAGAIISIACREIVMSPRSTTGLAMPIMMGTEGVTAVPEALKPKAYGPMMEEVRDSARRNGYSVLMCEAMVLPEREIFWVQNGQTGEKRFVTRSERDRLFGISSTQPGAASQPIDATSRSDWQYITSTPLIPEVKQPVISYGELLTMSQDEAISYGFARPTMVSTVAQLQELYGLSAPPLRLESNWSEDLVAWLTSPIVRGILLMVALLAGYIELNHPGVILPGVVAAVFLALFLGAPYLTGLANVWDILLVVVGLLLIALEIFVIPGFGAAGIAGVVLLLVGLVASFVPTEWPGGPFHWPTSQYAWTSLRNGMLSVSLSLAAALAGMVILSRHFRRMPYLNRLASANPQPQEVSLEDWFGGLPAAGEVGVSIGALRPAGKARFGGKVVDVVAESDFIEAGQAVQVIERVGNRVVVRQTTQS